MIYYEQFAKNEGTEAVMNDIGLRLKNVGVLPPLYELAHMLSFRAYPGDGIDVDARRHAWQSGYVHALHDLVDFKRRHLDQIQASESAKPNFNSIEELLKAGEITEAEAEKLRNEQR